ncbi:uncharacterized protein G2W53_033680 [Senna tora]|uniref:Uncharacterized protein n=1 Tax=Senna tora TaxID=362788 RepID=A0A834WD19_9FABA|nr:uncharacterized protein G2W53_033680 [Senna tora]
MRQKTCCASESNTSVRVVFANQSGFDARIGVVLAWEELGSCLNIFRMKKITVGSQKPSRITRQKTCFASVSNTSVRILFANRSGFDALIGVVLAWEQRGSCLNIFSMKNRGQISETFPNYKAKDLLRNRLGMGGAWIMSQHILDDKSWSDLRNLHELRGKRLVAQVSQTRQFANQSGFDAPIGVVSAWEERGSCLNIFWMTNPGWISETFTNYEAKDLLRKRVKQERGSKKLSRITRQKTCCASESNTSIRVVLGNRSGFDAPIGVLWIWQERGSCLNKFRTTNRGRISETFTNYEAKELLRKWVKDVGSRTGVVLILQLELSWHGRCVDHVSTYFGLQIAVGSKKPSRITRQKTCCASETNTSVCVVFANRSDFTAPIGVALAWEERGSCLNIFRKINRNKF